MTTRAQIKKDLIEAMRVRATARVAALRTLLGAIDNAGAVPAGESSPYGLPVVGPAQDVPRQQLGEEEIQTIIQAEADDYAAAIAEYERLGQHESAADLRARLDALQDYLGV